MPRSVYAMEDRERGMAALIVAGSSAQASELVNIPASTLREWKADHPERYAQLRTELHGKVAEQIASEAEHMAQRLARIEHQMADKLEAGIDKLDAKDLPGALRNVTTSKALQIDKLSSPLRERPSHVQQGRDLDQVVSAMARLVGFDATAVAIDITDAVPLPAARDASNAREQSSPGPA
jgi:hypothetical protein